jgi:hypothetical protein
MQFELKIVNDRLVVDLAQGFDDELKCWGYDGLPNKYDMMDIGPAKAIGTVELTDDQMELIKAEYAGGGECGWCGEVARELRDCHIFDRGTKGQKMCQHCWDHDREVYKGSYGEDIGPFKN